MHVTPESDHPVAVILDKTIAGWETMGVHSMLERFVRRNGRAGHPSALPKGVRPGKPNLCFMNAAQSVIWDGSRPKALQDLDLTYVEGYAMRPSVGIPLHHAWLESPSGEVLDLTWRNPEGCLYWGVSVSTDDLRFTLMRTGVYGVLDLGHRLNHEFMFAHDPDLELIITAAQAKAQEQGPRFVHRH